MLQWGKKIPQKGGAYAITTGIYCGEIFVFIEQKEQDLHFISIPKNINRVVPQEKFNIGLSESIVDVVGTIPKKFLKILEAQYKYNAKRYK